MYVRIRMYQRAWQVFPLRPPISPVRATKPEAPNSQQSRPKSPHEEIPLTTGHFQGEGASRQRENRRPHINPFDLQQPLKGCVHLPTKVASYAQSGGRREEEGERNGGRESNLADNDFRRFLECLVIYLISCLFGGRSAHLLISDKRTISPADHYC